MVDFAAINQVNQWRTWYFDAFDHIVKQIKADVDSLGKGPFQNPAQIGPLDLVRLERVISSLHLCCKGMPAIDAPEECGMEAEVGLLARLSHPNIIAYL
jgi:hypothetical protein